MRRHCLLFLTLYCAAFTLLAIPFTRMDETLLYDAGLGLLHSDEALAPQNSFLAQADLGTQSTKAIR